MDMHSLFLDYGSLPEYDGQNLTDVNQVSLFGDRPIHIAATRGSIDELTFLFENGADINCAGEDGYTPLHDAVEQGHIAVVKWLLDQGAESKKKDNLGQTPLDLARLLGRDDIELLLANSPSV